MTYEEEIKLLNQEDEEIQKRLRSTPIAQENDDDDELEEVEVLAKNFQALTKKTKQIIKEKNRVQKSEITNFPDKQEVIGIDQVIEVLVSLKEVMDKIQIPEVQTVAGGVNATVEFPKVQKVSGEVTAQVEFPKVQKVSGEVTADVHFPEEQLVKMNGPMAVTGFPEIDGDKWDGRMMPIVFTDGKKLYNPFTQQVQSNGRLGIELRSILAQLRTGVLATVESFDRTAHLPFHATITNSTQESIILPTVSGAYLDVYGIALSNTSSSPVVVTIKDAQNGGVRFVIPVPANDIRGFMLPEKSAHPQATATTNWTATCSVAISTLEVTTLAIKRAI